MKRTYVMPLVVLTLICIVASAALALMETVTRPIISAAAAEREAAMMSEIILEAEGFEYIDLSGLSGVPQTIRAVYRTTNNVGYIFIAEVSGFSGVITIICGIDQDGQIIKTVPLSHSETQGIGTIIDTPAFLTPFQGGDSTLEGIDTVTGATITTRAFINAINDIFQALEEIRNGA
ncbi:MAG: FMN-binding protein [Oscillospiraceae bacterium]|nr:FMN-binding protein [Oscillospiraceae bacterium]MCL2279561.1 FMN-binding protein [Oscillospiraceae bacterium]